MKMSHPIEQLEQIMEISRKNWGIYCSKWSFI